MCATEVKLIFFVSLQQVKSLQSVEKYCLLVVGLLQDGEEEVRNEMACSIGTILSTIPASVGMCM